jgi:hypothetical protein
MIPDAFLLTMMIGSLALLVSTTFAEDAPVGELGTTYSCQPYQAYDIMSVYTPS